VGEKGRVKSEVFKGPDQRGSLGSVKTIHVAPKSGAAKNSSSNHANRKTRSDGFGAPFPALQKGQALEAASRGKGGKNIG